MYRARTVRELLRSYERQLERKDEMIQSLLDRIQHPDRTPIWREAPQDAFVFVPEQPLPAFQGLELVPDPDQLP